MYIDATEPKAGGDASLDPSHVRVRRRQILLAGEQQGDVHRDTRGDRRFDGRRAFRRAGNLHQEIGEVRLRMKLGRFLDRASRIVGKQRRDFERHPSVQTLRRVVDRPEQRRGLAQILDRELEEQGLADRAFAAFLTNRVVVEMAVLDGMVKNRRVRRQPGHRPLIDVRSERAAGQQPARDVVEPEALSEVVKSGRGTRRCFCRHVILSCPSS